MKLLFFFFLTTFFVDSTINKEDVIIWHNDRQLSWFDFKGPVQPKNKKHIAMSKCGISMKQSSYLLHNGQPTYTFFAFFVPSSSWYIKEKATDKTLKHEQLHFNIAELYARKLRKAFTERNIKPKNAKTLFNKIYQEYEKTQQLYDVETHNGTEPYYQQKWVLKVDGELKLLDKYQRLGY